jgi:hypothetical protein
MDPFSLVSAAGAALGFLGGERRNAAQAEQASSANTFSAQQYATRYQTTVKDMQAAGLNPMLAYSQGGGSPPTGQQAQMSDSITPAVQSGTSAYLASLSGRKLDAEIKNIEADTEQKEATAMMNRGEAWNKLPQGEASSASAYASRASGNLSEVMAEKVGAEIRNVPLEGQRLKAATIGLAEQASLASQQGVSQEVIRRQLEEAIRKLNKENTLLGLDIEAAQQVGNFGREAGQLAPFVQMIVSILRGISRR